MFLEMMIIQACVNLTGPSHDACTKGTEAAMIQMDVKSAANNTEQKATAIIEKRVSEVTGQDALALALFAAKTVKSKEISTRLVKNDGLTPSVNTSVGIGSGSVMLGWNF